ncbi:MAG: ABC transporter permease [Rhizobacter sp.]
MTSVAATLRPYRAAFLSRFTQMLQYRSAALAGFATQCWWGGIKAMVLAAFYRAAGPEAAGAPLSFGQAVTYTWVAQALLALLPWVGDPEVAQAVRSGAVAYDRLRPVDAYALWYVRSGGWIAARALPRALLMFAFAALLLPLVGLPAWRWLGPADASAALWFACALVLALLLATAMLMLINVAVLATLNERGVTVLATPIVVVFSGNLLPLGLFPDALQTALRWQPFAGLLDIPLRLYFGQWRGVDAAAGLALQAFWVIALIALGRALMARSLRMLEVQGG